jgi:SnoaL-like domain
VIADSDVNLRWEVVDAFLAASRGGDFEALLALLDPDVVLRADPATVRMGASEEVRGPAAVAETFWESPLRKTSTPKRRSRCRVVRGGQPRVAFSFTISRGKIVEIKLISDPARLQELDLTMVAV